MNDTKYRENPSIFQLCPFIAPSSRVKLQVRAFEVSKLYANA